MQHYDRSMLRRQAQERPLEQLAVGDLVGCIRDARPVDQRPDVDAPPPMPARLFEAGVDDDAMEPDVEAFRVAKTRQVPPGEQEGLLDGVAGPLGVAKDPVRNAVAPTAVPIDELGAGDLVALLRSFDQPRLHWRPLVPRPRLGRFGRYRRSQGPKGSTPGRIRLRRSPEPRWRGRCCRTGATG